MVAKAGDAKRRSPRHAVAGDSVAVDSVEGPAGEDPTVVWGPVASRWQLLVSSVLLLLWILFLAWIAFGG